MHQGVGICVVGDDATCEGVHILLFEGDVTAANGAEVCCGVRC